MRTRILEGDELARLVHTADGPFYNRPDVVSQLGNVQVVALENDAGDLVAYWPIWVAVHLEPLWIAEEVRKNPAAARQLVEAMRAQLAENRIDTAFAIIGHADLATHLPMATRLGFQRMPGDLFFLGGSQQGERDGSSSGTGDQPGGAVLHESGREQAHRPGAQHRHDGPPELGE